MVNIDYKFNQKIEQKNSSWKKLREFPRANDKKSYQS